MARKVLFYTHAFSGGGAETVFARLAAAFAEAGDDVIFVADHSGPLPLRDRTRLRHVRLDGGHVRGTRTLAALLRRERPDASFSALGAQNLKHLVASTWAGRRHRCILGYHGFADAEPMRLSRMSFWSSPAITRLAVRTVCVSDALLADVRTRWHGSRTRTVRIYNPLPTAVPSTCGDKPARDEPPLILGCGRLVPGKRFPDLVAALAGLQPTTARLTILGEGPERTTIEAAIARLGLEGRVDLPGHVADPTPWYRRASCLVIASDSESFGLTAAEALAQGTPVVATDCGGPAEILGHGRYGRIVPVGDAAALSAALRETLAAPGDPQPRLRQAEMFAVGTIHQAYADLIDSLP